MNKGIIWVVVIIALGVGAYAGYAYEKAKFVKLMEAQRLDMQRQIDEAKKTSSVSTPTQESLMTAAMQDSASKKVTLTDVSGGKGTGTAYILRKNGKLTFTVTAKVPDPATGAFYEAWIVNKDTNKSENMGKLTKGKDGSYEVSKGDEDAYEGFNMVVVTLEKVDDQKPEKHLLEGTAE